MWKIIKTELAYYRTLILFLLAVFTSYLFLYSTWQTYEIIYSNLGTLGLMFVIELVFCISIYSTWSAARRDLLLARLPAADRNLSFVRIIIPMIFWFVLVFIFIWFEVTLKGRIDPDIRRYLLSCTGIIMILNANYFLVRDMTFAFKRKYKILGIYNDQIPGILYPMFIMIISFIYSIYIVNSLSYNQNIFAAFFTPFFSGYAPIILFAGGVCLSFITYRTYLKRLEYLY
ncbi:hypothetical protein ACFL6G_06365 [candidate division KSB1 bacterium]